MPETIMIQGMSAEEFMESMRKIVREELAGMKNSTGSELKYYSRDEACKLLKISMSTLDQYVRAGIIKGSRFGRRILFSETDIETAIREIPAAKHRRR